MSQAKKRGHEVSGPPQQRILYLWREAERLSRAYASLPGCPLRDKLAERDGRLRKELADLVRGLLEREPEACTVHAPSRCSKPNKGTALGCLQCALGAALILSERKQR